VPAEDLRERIRATLAAAYGEGLLSQGTLSYRLDQLTGATVIDPAQLVGDLNLRAPERRPGPIARLRRRLMQPRETPPAPSVLALDWAGTTDAVLIGRHPFCDVRLSDPTVSRRHAMLHFRDGHWVLQDLGSLNGTTVNGERVNRCQLRAADSVRFGDQHLVVD
jgi:hypothetical protein